MQAKRPRPDLQPKAPADQLKGYSLSSPKAKPAKAKAVSQPAQPQKQPPQPEPDAASDEEAAALTAAVSAAQRNDAAVRETLGPQADDSEPEDAADVVHFPGAYAAFSRKPKQKGLNAAKAKPKAPGGCM